jgi:DegV family protein with EDD domain
MTTAEPVAVVTDSTASVPACAGSAASVTVVPLRILAGDVLADDGADGTAGAIEAALASGERVTTARPVPAQFAAAYQAAADGGARAVLSIHLSGMLSGTVSSAALAAASSPVPVLVLDSGTIGSGLGLVVLTAAVAAGEGLDLDAVAVAARRCAEHARSLLAVDRPDALLASGRTAGLTGATPSGGTARRLVSRTVLEIRSGRITVVDRVRTWAAAAEVLAGSAVEPDAAATVDVVVEHVGAQDRASGLAARLAADLPQAGGHVPIVAAGDAIRIHAGQPMLGVSVAPSPADG